MSVIIQVLEHIIWNYMYKLSTLLKSLTSVMNISSSSSYIIY